MTVAETLWNATTLAPGNVGMLPSEVSNLAC